MDSSFISNLILATVRMAVPLIFIATAELYSERAGMVNIGLEGLAAIGSLVGFLMCYITGSAWIGILCGALAGILVNMIYAFATVTLCSLPVPRSFADTLTMPLESMLKVTSICGTPRGAGAMPVSWKRPRVLLS